MDDLIPPPRPTQPAVRLPWRAVLAWWSLWLIRWRPIAGVDYTRRCRGCGCYDGDPDQGADHYGWSCGFADYPWWAHLVEWWWSTGLIGRLRSWWWSRRHPAPWDL